MTETTHTIRELKPSDLEVYSDDLCRILMDSVSDGASISFMATLTKDEAEAFWLNDVKTSVANGERRLFGAFLDDRLIGTVQVVVGMPPNQPHRAEISKMVVHPAGRRRGLGRALLQAAIQVARDSGKTLVTLDTRTGDASEALYRDIGFKQAGVIPDFAFDPDGKARHSTTYMYLCL